MANLLETVDDYIASYPADVQSILEEFRQAIRKAAPRAEETISYQMPTFTLNGKYLVYLGAWKHHIGLYPIPRLESPLEKEISQYRSGGDTLRFQLKEPAPTELVERIVVMLVKRRLAEER